MRIRAIVIVFAAVVAGCSTLVPEQDAAPAPAVEAAPVKRVMRDLTESEKVLLADSFSAGLNDPDTIKYRWARVPELSNDIHSFEYCGLLNMKDSAGRYAGLHPFLATVTVANKTITGGAIAALNSDNRKENENVIPSLCRQKGLDPSAAK